MEILREKATGRMVQQGDKLKDFRGDEHTVLDWYARPAPSTGRVETDRGSFYPSVIGCYLETQGFSSCTCGTPTCKYLPDACEASI